MDPSKWFFLVLLVMTSEAASKNRLRPEHRENEDGPTLPSTLIPDIEHPKEKPSNPEEDTLRVAEPDPVIVQPESVTENLESESKEPAIPSKPETEEQISYRGAQLLRVIVEKKEHEEELHQLEQKGEVDIWSHKMANDSRLDVMVSEQSIDNLKNFLDTNSVRYEVVIDDLQSAIDVENPPLTDEEKEELEGEGRKGHRMSWENYHRLSDINSYLDYLVQTFPNFISLETIGSSVEGQPLRVLKIAGENSGGQAIWVDGGIHAREWISPAAVTYVINELVENRNQQLQSLRSVDWYILPVVNPDGYEHSHSSNRFWRKNRRGNSKCVGVDLNRNFGYKWGGLGAGTQKCDQTYAGPSKFSEPETAAISKFVLRNSAKIKGYLSFHSYGQYILYPWGYDKVVPPDHQRLKTVGQKIASTIRDTTGSTYTVGPAAVLLYPAAGGSDDWAKGVAHIPFTYTIELRDRGRYGFVVPASYIVPTGQEALAVVKVVADEVVKLTNE